MFVFREIPGPALAQLANLPGAKADVSSSSCFRKTERFKFCFPKPASLYLGRHVTILVFGVYCSREVGQFALIW